MLASTLLRSLSQPAWHHSSRARARRRDSQDVRRYASARDATWLRLIPFSLAIPISLYMAAACPPLLWQMRRLTSEESNRRFGELQKATGRGNRERPRCSRNRDVKEFGLGLIFSGEMRRVWDHHMVELQPFQQQGRRNRPGRQAPTRI
jgi:hypothetical protein